MSASLTKLENLCVTLRSSAFNSIMEVCIISALLMTKVTLMTPLNNEVIDIYPATVDWCNLVLETLQFLDRSPNLAPQSSIE